MLVAQHLAPHFHARIESILFIHEGTPGVRKKASTALLKSFALSMDETCAVGNSIY